MQRKNGSDARLVISEMKKPFGDIKFIIQVAAVSWAATAVPETKLASQILRNAPFCKAFGVEFGFMRDVLSSEALGWIEDESGPPLTGITLQPA